jgi:hypothetical protein
VNFSHIPKFEILGCDTTSLEEVESQPCWHLAMVEEIKAIEDNHAWELTELLEGRRAIGVKWVFKVKRNEAGTVVRHKVRLVVKGYSQRQGVDYEEVFARVARLEAERLLIALAAHQSWEVHHLDVKSTFLNRELNEEVYVAQPPSFVRADSEGKVLRLKKALYGLHQAPRAWNQKLDTSLVSLGFQRCLSDPTIYYRGGKQGDILIL